MQLLLSAQNPEVTMTIGTGRGTVTGNVSENEKGSERGSHPAGTQNGREKGKENGKGERNEQNPLTGLPATKDVGMHD
ncbi:hypothetical protein J6590_013110 [Homalodisca vitripennis]|nr:hypothetical protein J6590_013110 [Homalodisca vitripennis]